MKNGAAFIEITGEYPNSLAGENRSLVLLQLRSNDINNKGIGYLLELLFLSEEREEP